MNTLELLSQLRHLGVQLSTDGEKLNCNAPKDVLTSSLRSQLSEHKAEIIALLQNQNSSLSGNFTSNPIGPASREQDLPLSFAQERLWFLDRLEPNSPFYNIPRAVRLSGDLNIQVLQRALDAIVGHHEILRTNYTTKDGNPIQVINAPRSVELTIIDFQQYESTERETQVRQLLHKECQKPFNLASDMMLRGCLLQLAPQEYVLLLVMHHIASDGWSMGILWEQLTKIYQAFLSNKPNPLKTLSIQYADYAVWQRQWLSDEVLNQQLDYWKQQLSGANPILELPTDRPRPAVQSYRGDNHSLVISQTLTDKLKQLCRQEGVTLYMTLLATLQTLLYKYSGQEDILVGSAIAGRKCAELEDLIGFFVNTLVLRTNFSDNSSFLEVLQKVRLVTLEAYSHQDLPFNKLVEELQPERSLSHHPLFQVMFVLQNAPRQSEQLLGLTETSMPLATETAKFDLTLSVIEKNEVLICSWEYNTDLFDAATIERMTVHFQNLLEDIVENPQQPISHLSLLSQAERQQLLVEWNQTQTNYPQDKCIHHLFEKRVKLTPQAVAVVFEGQQLSYQELNAKANQMARYLQKLGVGPEVCVGLCVERSLEMIVGLLGILKAGGAYVPLDSKYPKERLELMLSDSQVSVLLTQEKLLTHLPELHAEIIYLDRLWDNISEEDPENLISEVETDNLAYICYTSGSTGKPKGVCVSHRGVVRLVKETNYVDLSSNEVFLQLAPISFDAATFEIWGSLLNGAKLVIMSAHIPSLQELGQVIQHHQISTLWLTAGLFHLMVDERLQDLSCVRQLLAGGDVLSVSHVQKVLQELPKCKLINGYGPTENTTFTCCYTITELPQNNNSIPIGKPISNTQVYILDRYLQPLAIGVPGELYIGGDGLARGYLNRPELNSEKFIPYPFVHQSGQLLYKTGDKVRYLPDGNIEFLGRIDDQVKIRGFRIELGEIEAALLQLPSVQKAIVIVNEDLPGDKRLVAYVVANLEQQISNSELRNFLKHKLPEYMVPSAFVMLESLPLNPNGKVDRRALPRLNAFDIQTSENYIAPRTAQEQQIADIFAKALKLERVSINDNFFELGGHSLLAVQVFSEIEKALNTTLPLSLLFQQPTVKELAQALQAKEKSSSSSCLVALQPHGSKTPIFGVHAIGTSVQFYRELAIHLGSDRPFYGLQSLFLDRASCDLTIEDMAAAYIEETRKIQPKGPYLLGGFSFGGRVVYEMAQQLLETGQKVALLALIDAPAPGGYRRLTSQEQISQHWNNFRNKGTAYAVEKISNQLNFRAFLLKKSFKKLAPSRSQQAKQSKFFEARLRKIEAIHKQTLNNYQFREYSGKITLFRAATKHNNVGDAWEPTLGWNKFAKGGLDICDLPGNHSSIFKEPNVKIFAEKLNYCIEQALKENVSDTP